MTLIVANQYAQHELIFSNKIRKAIQKYNYGAIYLV